MGIETDRGETAPLTTERLTAVVVDDICAEAPPTDAELDTVEAFLMSAVRALLDGCPLDEKTGEADGKGFKSSSQTCETLTGNGHGCPLDR